MATAIKSARKELSPYAPTIFEMEINPRKIKDVIGSGGNMIRSICEKSKTKIEILDTGVVKIAGTSQDEIDIAKNLIEKICIEPELGKTYDCEVIKILEFGAIVSFMEGEEGMIHISEFKTDKIKDINDLVKVGDKLKAKVIDIYNGKIKLSLK